MGGGCLWDVGVYPLSFAQYCLGGLPDWVIGSQFTGNTGVDEFFTGQLGYSGNRFAQISASFRTPFYTFVEVIGTEGRLSISMPFVGVNDSKLLLSIKNKETVRLQVHPKSLYLGEIEDMHSAILDNKPNYISLQETRYHIQTVLALYKSAKLLNVVRLAESKH